MRLTTMYVTEDLIRSVVQEVLINMKAAPAPVYKTGGQWGVFDDVDSAVAAASAAQKKFESLGLAARKKAVDVIRKICLEQAERLGRQEFEETKIGRLAHK